MRQPSLRDWGGFGSDTRHSATLHAGLLSGVPSGLIGAHLDQGGSIPVSRGQSTSVVGTIPPPL